MLPLNISNRISQYYIPGNIANYDQVITFNSFFDLFAPIENINEAQIKQALKDLKFTGDCKLDDNYLVLIAC